MGMVYTNLGETVKEGMSQNEASKQNCDAFQQKCCC